MSSCIRGGLLAALLAALASPSAFAISNTTTTSPLTLGVSAPAATIQRADGLYTAGGAAVMLGTPNFRARVGTPEAMAREFLAARHDQLGLDTSDAASLVRTALRTGSHFSVVRFSQRLNGVPVYGSDIAISVMPNGRVIYISNATVPGATAVNALARTPSADALAIGAQYLGITAARHQKAERMIYAANGTSRLVWRVELEAEAGTRGDWELLVDANTGEILRAEDKAAYDDGNGTIWTPDPLSEDLATYNDPGYVDGNNADTPQLTAALRPVTLEGITLAGGNYTLTGPYAVCQDFDTPHDAGCPSQATSDFSVTRSALTFDAVMGYFHITTYLKYVNETLGVVALPLNHPGGVHYDPHGFDNADNSQYSSGGENLTFGAGGVDDAQDADVIIHELGHGIHDWITNGNLSQNEGLSEGVGDYNAGSYSRDWPNQWTPSDTPYFWTFSWDGHNPFWPGRVTNYELNHTYAQARNQEIHTAGQYWASCNLLVRDVIGGEIMDKAYFEGLSMTGGNTNQMAAAQAVINAAAALGYSAGQIQAFADAYNSGNAGGHAGCTYAVTVPDTSGPAIDVDTTPLTGTAAEGDSTSTSFTIGNTGDAALDWNVDTSDNSSCATPATTPWISFAPPSGTVAAGDPATSVTVTMDAATLTAGDYTTFACVHSNDGGTPVVAVPVTFTVTGGVDDTIFADGFDTGAGPTCAPEQLFQDPSFEATDGSTFTNPFWTSDDSVSGSTLCDATCDTSGGGLVARTGDWFVWFGGWDQANTSHLSQDVTFPAGEARWLNYWMINQIGGDPTAALTLSIDGTSVLTFDNTGGESDYAPHTFEIPSTYLDGASHLVQFNWSADSPTGVEIGGAMFDDLTLDCSAQQARAPFVPRHGAPAPRRTR